MKKAIALGVLLSASFVSFAFAANMMFVDKTMTNGEVLHLDAVNANGLNYYNISVFDANGGTVSFKLDFPSGYETGYLSIVETSKPRPEFVNDSGIGWVSMTPGGEPIDLGPKSMYQPKFESGFISWGPLRFYHPSLRAKGGRYATDQFTFLEHGTYYYNVKVANPAGFIIVYQLGKSSTQDAFGPVVPNSNPTGASGVYQNMTVKPDANGIVQLANGYQFLVDDTTPAGSPGKMISFKFDLPLSYDNGHLSIVEYPSMTEEVPSYDQVWISRTPGGEAVANFPKQKWDWMEGHFDLTAPGSNSSNINKAHGHNTDLESGQYYLNVVPNKSGYFFITFGAFNASGGQAQGTSQNVNKSQEFVAAPVTLNSAGVPIVTSTYDLNARPATRLIPATGGTKSVAIAFPSTKGGALMMVPGIAEYVRPDRTEVNISTKPNDFTPIQPACNQINEISSEITLQWVTNASDQPAWGACVLEQNKIYYFNIRYVKADGTTACREATCGAYMDLPPLGTITVPTENGFSSNTSCSLLSKNLGIGSKDSLTNGEVTKLQNFLYPTYLKVEPTGYYGNMTAAAVKSFQASYGISQVGVVGPQTKAKISEISCSGAVLSEPEPIVDTPKSMPVIQPTYQVSGGIAVTAPFAGQTVKNEASKVSITTITWQDNSSSKANTVTIDLLDTSGNRVKTIASDTSNTGSYVWRYDPTLENGTYRISIRGANSSGQSGSFSIGGEGSIIKSTTVTNQLPKTQIVSCNTSADYITDATTQGGGQYFFPLTGTKSMAVKFKPEFDYGGGNVKYFGQVAVAITPGNNSSRMIQMVVSQCPGDFTNKASANGICSRYGVEGGGNVAFGTQSTASTFGVNLCGPLDKTKTYYANVRYVDPSTNQSTCDPAYGQCNTVVGITYGNPAQDTAVSVLPIERTYTSNNPPAISAEQMPPFQSGLEVLDFGDITPNKFSDRNFWYLPFTITFNITANTPKAAVISTVKAPGGDAARGSMIVNTYGPESSTVERSREAVFYVGNLKPGSYKMQFLRGDVSPLWPAPMQIVVQLNARSGDASTSQSGTTATTPQTPTGTYAPSDRTSTGPTAPYPLGTDVNLGTDGVRAVLKLQGNQSGSVAFNSWRILSSGTKFSGGFIQLGEAPELTDANSFPTRKELNISKTKGSFVPIAPECTNVPASMPARTLSGLSWTTDSSKKGAGDCLLEPNTVYYANVRFVATSGDSSCPSQYCAQHVNITPNAIQQIASAGTGDGLINLSAPATLTPAMIDFTGLARGANEARVSKLKAVLNNIPASISAGCINLSTTNTLYGPTTESCVKVFQGMYGLAQTGAVDAATNAALNKAMTQ